MIIQRAYEEPNRFHWKEEELRAYEAVVKHELDYQASLDFKFEQGMQKGLQQGIEKGKAEGEKKALVKVAQNMLKQDLSIQNIASATGLSSQEVKKIQETR